MNEAILDSVCNDIIRHVKPQVLISKKHQSNAFFNINTLYTFLQLR